MGRIRRMFTCAALVLTLAPLPSYGWFFFFIPGSLFTSSEKNDIGEFHRKMDWAGLLEFAQKKIDSDPANADWWIQKGWATQRLRDFANAEAAFKQAIKLQPSSYIATNELGVLYNAQGKHREALDQYLAALKIKPDSTVSLVNAAVLQYRLGRPDLTWDHYQQLLPLDPALAKRVKDQFLLSDLRPVTPTPKTEATPSSPAASPAMVSTTAVPEAPKTQSQGNEAEQIGRANVLWDAKNFSELVTYSESWSLANANSPNAWYYLGLGYYGLGAKDKALPAFKEALRLKPDLPDAIARILTMRGEKSRIQEIYAVLTQIDTVKAEEFKVKYLVQ